jgi:hypothetical protein
MNLFPWLIVGLCCSLLFALWAAHRYRVRAYIVRAPEDISQREHICECGIEGQHATCVCVICGATFPNSGVFLPIECCSIHEKEESVNVIGGRSEMGLPPANCSN